MLAPTPGGVNARGPRCSEFMICPLFVASEVSAKAGVVHEATEEVAMVYGLAAVRRAMTIREVVLRAMSGEYSWYRAAEILDLDVRSLRRWRRRFEQYGYDGLVDRRRGTPSPRRAPLAEVERVLRLYRERYPGFNGRHFHEIA